MDEVEISLLKKINERRTTISEKYRNPLKGAKSAKIRFMETIKRFKKIKPHLDIGEENPLGQLLGADDYTGLLDLNWPWDLGKKYNTITCFEVIEHIQNPLLMLIIIKQHLSENGKLYLTTPVSWLLGKGEYHFIEYNRNDLLELVKMAGMQVIEFERIRGYTWCWRYLGIRPIIRLIRDIFFGRGMFLIIKKQ